MKEPTRDRDDRGRARNARPRDATGRPLPRGAQGIERIPDDLVLGPDEAVTEAQRLLDAGLPFQAHEVLEGAWKLAPDPERELWRALAQLAVGLTHAQRGNARGATALLHRAVEHLDGWDGPVPARIDVAGLAAHARALAHRITTAGVEDMGTAAVTPRLRGRAGVFPPGFFDRSDPSPDTEFYDPPRLVTHIDDPAVAAVGDLYSELGIDGEVLDLMSSWISHFPRPPRRLVGLGMNAAELAANPMLAAHVVHDLNADPRLPFDDGSFDDVTCCVSVDYLVEPVAVFREVARVLRPGGRFVVTFSNRCFPTKAIRGWLGTDDEQHVQIVNAYFVLSDGFAPARGQRRTPPGPGDPLYAVWAERGQLPPGFSATTVGV